MDATRAIQDSIHVFSLVRKYVSRILGTYHCDGTCLNFFKNPDRGSGLVSWACAAFSPV